MLTMIRAARSLSERATGALRIAGASPHGMLRGVDRAVETNATRLSAPPMLGGLNDIHARHITFVSDPFQREKEQAAAAKAKEGT